MANLNRVMLMGNLTRDPEIRYTPKGTALVEFGIAINRSYTSDTGERRDETTFVDITFWGRSAETISQYMSKGRSIYIEGRLQLDTWDDKQTGQKRSRLRVVGDSFQFLGSRPDGSGQGGSQEQDGSRGSSNPQARRPSYTDQGQRSAQPSTQTPADPDHDELGDDDIPF